MLASRIKRMEVLDKLRSKLPPHAIKRRYGRAITEVNASDSSLDKQVQRFSTLEPDVDPLTPDQEALLKNYLDHVETTRLLREHLGEFDKNLDDFKYMVRSQAVAELTNYRGISDWGETMQSYVSAYATGLGTLSIAGAGLVYSTIFSGNQGAGLMSLTFPLFTVGFLVPGFVYIGTCFAANVPREMTFASQRFWTVAMVFALFVASLMVIGAIVIVNVTIFNLHLNSNSSGHISLAEIAGIISLIFSGTVIVVAFAAFILGLFSRKMRISMKEYYSRVTTKEKDALNTYHHV